MSYEYFKEKVGLLFKQANVIGVFDYDEEKGLYIAYSSDGILITANANGREICCQKRNGFKAKAVI